MDYMSVTDCISGRAILVIEFRDTEHTVLVIEDNVPQLVKPRAIGKVIRNWMKLAKQDNP